MNVDSNNLKFLFSTKEHDYYKYENYYIVKSLGLKQETKQISFEKCFIDYMLYTKNPNFIDLNLSYLTLYEKMIGYDPSEIMDIMDFELLSELIYIQGQELKG